MLIKTIIPSFYRSQASTDQPLCFKMFIMASHQSVVNINIIMNFPIGYKAFVSLGVCTMSHCVLLSLTAIDLVQIKGFDIEFVYESQWSNWLGRQCVKLEI